MGAGREGGGKRKGQETKQDERRECRKKRGEEIRKIETEVERQK